MKANRSVLRRIAFVLALLFLWPHSTVSADGGNSRMPTRIVSTIKKGSPTMNQFFTWWTKEKVEDPILLISLSDTFTTANTYDATVEEVQSTVFERDANGEVIFENTATGTTFTAKDRPAGWEPNGNERPKTRTVTEYVYKAEAFTLFPNMTYYYRVGSRSNPALQSGVGNFSTSTLSGEPFRFLHIADTQTAGWNEAEGRATADAYAAMLNAVPNAGFVLHAGNVTQSAGWEDNWMSLFNPAQKSIMSRSFVPVPGPRDEGINAWDNHFTVPKANPEEASYYFFDFNNARVLVLDTNDTGDHKGYLAPKQIDWMKRNIEDAKKQNIEWIIVAMHQPLYGLSHRMGDPKIAEMRAPMMDLFQTLGVDLVLSGGEGQYIRTKPLVYEGNAAYAAPASESSEHRGTVFVSSGPFGKVAYDALLSRSLSQVQSVLPSAGFTQAGLDAFKNAIGASLQPNSSSATDGDRTARHANTQMFTSYSISGRVLKGTAYRVDKGVAKAFDTFVIDKDNPQAKPDPLPGDSPSAKPTVERISGSDRYATAVETSKAAFSRSEIALLASGEAYPDSLAASGLAGTLKAPILLVPKSGVPSSVQKEMERIGVKKVLLIGGEASVTPQVEAALKGLIVERIAGKDRYETAKKIGERVATLTGGAQALFASGESFPDALALSGVAAARRAPVMLTPKASLHAQAVAFLEKTKPTSALVAGGEGTLSKAAFDAVASRVAHTDRVEGTDRAQTSLAIARWSFPYADTVILASGEGFADALVAANLSAVHDAPILLASSKGLHADLQYWITQNKIQRIIVVGGEGTLPDSVVQPFR